MQTYDESFSAVFISADLKNIVVIGPRYHYVFDVEESLVRLIQSDLHKQLKGDFGGFAVRGDNKISGNLWLVVDDKALAERAAALGMQRSADGTAWSTNTLKGTRYAAGKISRPTQDQTALNKQYVVTINDYSSDSSKASPVQQTSNGLLTLLTIPLLPVFIVLAIRSCPACR